MDLIDRLREIAHRIPKQLEHIQTEEATKNALVMPFISALGYDVFNPNRSMISISMPIGYAAWCRSISTQLPRRHRWHELVMRDLLQPALVRS